MVGAVEALLGGSLAHRLTHVSMLRFFLRAAVIVRKEIILLPSRYRRFHIPQTIVLLA